MLYPESNRGSPSAETAEEERSSTKPGKESSSAWYIPDSEVGSTLSPIFTIFLTHLSTHSPTIHPPYYPSILSADTYMPGAVLHDKDGAASKGLGASRTGYLQSSIEGKH